MTVYERPPQDRSPEAVQQRARMRAELAAERAREAAEALKDHQAETDALAARVLHLRELRLARDAAAQEAKAAAAPEKAKPKAVRRAAPKG